MDVSSILTSIILVIVTALVTYFFTTRNIRDIVKKVMEKEIEVHKQIDHQANPWEVAEKKLAEHMIFCGNNVKENLKDLSDTVRLLSDTQIRHNTEIVQMNKLFLQLINNLEHIKES